MHERRKEGRSRSYLGGQAAFNHRNSTMDCLIRNISPSGAKLDVSDGHSTVPDEFELSIPVKSGHFRAHIRWRRNDELGVALMPSPTFADPAVDDARRSAHH